MGSGCKHDVYWYYLVFFHSFYSALKLAYFDILSSYFTTLGCYKWLDHDFVRFYLVSIGVRIGWLFMFYHFPRHWNVEIHNYISLFRKSDKPCPLTNFSKHFSTTKLTFLFVSLLLCLPPLCPLSLPRCVPFCGPGGFGTPQESGPELGHPPKFASIKWPDRVKRPKNHNRCWTGHFIEALHPIPPDPFEQRMPL